MRHIKQTENNKIAIVLAGNFSPNEKTVMQLESCDYIIAVDGGLNHLHKLNILPDLLIGDFDTVSNAALAWIEELDIPRKTFPISKDLTDGELAYEEAKTLDPEEIIFYACFSASRPDHVLNMLYLSQEISRDGLKVSINNGNVYAVTLEGPVQVEIDAREYFSEHELNELYVSIVPNSPIENLSYKGLQYSLDSANFEKYPEISLLSNRLKYGSSFELDFSCGNLTIFLLS